MRWSNDKDPVFGSSRSITRCLLSEVAAQSPDARLIFEKCYAYDLHHMLLRLQLSEALKATVTRRVTDALFDPKSSFSLNRYTGKESFAQYLRRAILELVMMTLRDSEISIITSDLETSIEVLEKRMIRELELQINNRLPHAFAEGWSRLSEGVRDRLCRTSPSGTMSPDHARWVSETRKALLRHQSLDVEGMALALQVIERRLEDALRAVHHAPSNGSPVLN